MVEDRSRHSRQMACKTVAERYVSRAGFRKHNRSAAACAAEGRRKAACPAPAGINLERARSRSPGSQILCGPARFPVESP